MLHPYIKRPRGLASPQPPWDARALCERYGWPTGLAGKGRIAIVELGGAYLPSDTVAFAARNGIPAPNVQHVYLDGASQTNMQDEASGEVALDAQIAACAYSVATGLPADITFFWATDIAPAIGAAAAAGMDVFSCSWGDDEAQWGHAPLSLLESTVRRATAAGMTVLAAAGDNDSSDGGPTPANVDAPASCPHVIGCGGTRLLHPKPAPIADREIVWNDNPGNTDGEGTGGGYSTYFPAQAWQAGAPAGPGRMVPDIAANADPMTGYNVFINGQLEVVGGTSAVAPLYAGLFGACGTKLGWVTPKLWLNHLDFHDVTLGDNGKFQALVGPDACTGLGSAIAWRVANLLMGK